MRAYYFGNLYMSSIQQGIQALHTTAEMFIKYGHIDTMSSDAHVDRFTTLRHWAEDHKTVILKQAGYSSDLLLIRHMLEDSTNPYPWAFFCEEGVDDALTCIGIILPEKVFGTADEVRKMPFSRRDKFLAQSRLSEFELDLVTVIIETSLAR